ncbi:MAG: E2 ubiquitin-conjugating protein mms2 [Watsoniomyces obsoletus]|nr:MAG: E2 ubiquitin-conjugating protein mms2 [Watsoniomyces obsoletus]
MAKSKSGKKKKTKRRDKLDHRKMIPTAVATMSPSIETPEVLLSQATTLLQTSQAQEALSLAQLALTKLEQTNSERKNTLPAIKLLADISVELGDIDQARSYYLHAVKLDPEGALPEDVGGGADKFLWLAQLCEEGGTTSVQWFQRGIQVLRKQIEVLEGSHDDYGDAKDNKAMMIVEKKDKISQALCGIAEVYMTDLSWDDQAESRCEAAVTEAVALSPESPEPLQTLASVRISQLQFVEARAALRKSMALWKDLAPEDPKVPAFPTRISLARLLLETEMEEEALGVLERLVTDDDQSVEAWYLGGWCLFILGEKAKSKTNVNANDTREAAEDGEAEWRSTWKSSREWLENSLKLYELLEYEDDRLQEHATELVNELERQVGIDGGEDDEVEEGWEDRSDGSASDQSMLDV